MAQVCKLTLNALQALKRSGAAKSVASSVATRASCDRIWRRKFKTHDQNKFVQLEGVIDPISQRPYTRKARIAEARLLSGSDEKHAKASWRKYVLLALCMWPMPMVDRAIPRGHGQPVSVSHATGSQDEHT